MTVDRFIKLFLLLLDGLQVAGKQFGYTHYDLHTANVFIRKLPAKWCFNIGGYWIETDEIPVVLDYGLSRMKIGENVIFPTSPDWIQYNGITTEYFPAHDIYKFLFYCLYSYPKLFMN